MLSRVLKNRQSFSIAIIVLAVSAVYGQFLWNPIVFDDNNFFDPNVRQNYLGTFFRLQFRWLPYASFEWTRAVLGGEIIWHRLGNLTLHILVAITLFFFLRRLFEAVLASDRIGKPGSGHVEPLSFVWLALFAALIFALHPAAVYGAAYLIQRTILMSTLFALIMWYLFLRGVTQDSQWSLLGSVFAYFLSVFAKEHALMAPAVSFAMLLMICKPDRRLLRRVWPTFMLYALIALYVAYQAKQGNLLGQAYEPRGEDMLSRLARLDPGFDPRLAYPLSILTQSFLFFKYLLVWVLPNPGWMAVDMFEPFATRFISWPHSVGFMAFVLYPIAAGWLLLRRGATGLLGLAMLFPWLMFAPELSTVRIQESFVIYRSYLWMPGALAAIAFLFRHVPARRAATMLTLLILVLIPATWARLTTFSSPFLLWNDAARLIKAKDNRPGVERVYHNRGLHLFKLGHFDLALEDFNKAISLNPNYILAYNDRGALYLAMKKYRPALADFNRALAINPQFARPYLGRAFTYEGLNDAPAALADYTMLCSMGYDEGCAKLKQRPAAY
jgi:tetratricopeptide (TPR) repeat protein